MLQSGGLQSCLLKYTELVNMSTIVDNNRSDEEVLPHELISFSEKAYQFVIRTRAEL